MPFARNTRKRRTITKMELKRRPMDVSGKEADAARRVPELAGGTLPIDIGRLTSLVAFSPIGGGDLTRSPSPGRADTALPRRNAHSETGPPPFGGPGPEPSPPAAPAPCYAPRPAMGLAQGLHKADCAQPSSSSRAPRTGGARDP